MPFSVHLHVKQSVRCYWYSSRAHSQMLQKENCIFFALLCGLFEKKLTDPPVHPDHLPTFTSWLFIVHFSGAPIVSAPCCYCIFTNACTFHPYVRQNPGTCTISSSGLAYYYRLCHCLQSISDKDSINCTVSGNMLILLQQSVLARW